MSPLRILEIGGHPLFKLAVPDQTDFYWASTKPPARGQLALGPIKFVQSLLKLRRGEYDLLVLHAGQYAWWHPRSFLTAMRDWHVRALLGLFSILAARYSIVLHKVPTAVVDLADTCLLGGHNKFLLKRCAAYFKRELPIDNWLVFCGQVYPNFPGARWRRQPAHIKMVGRLKPISLGTMWPDDALSLFAPSEKKETDIFFSGAIANNSTVRAAGLAELQTLQNEGYIIDFSEERLSPDEFLRRMSAAWLGWSPSGLGWECRRHYEAALAETVPLINLPTIIRDAPMRDGEHCLFYSVQAGGLADVARKALDDKPRLRAMANRAAIHVKRHHSNYARAERIAIEVIGRRLDGSTIAQRNDILGRSFDHVKSSSQSA